MAFKRALKTIEVAFLMDMMKGQRFDNPQQVERQGSLCMACYVREMDIWRERKEDGDPGLVSMMI